MTYEALLFPISLIAGIILLVLGYLDLVRDDFSFWPPPKKGSWQDRIFIWLFRAMLYPLLVMSILEFSLSEIPIIQFAIGSFLLVVGFGIALMSTFNLGWDNAFGDKQGLVTNGWFSHSRNPVYLVTWAGQLGWAILIPRLHVWIILALWAMLYLIAVHLEEKWLERRYGEEYLEYKNRVPRFF